MEQYLQLLNVGYDTNSTSLLHAHTLPMQAGIHAPTAQHELLAHACLVALFQLCRYDLSSHSSTSTISQKCVPLLIAKCEFILSSYLAAARAQPSTDLSVSRSLKEEVKFILIELRKLDVYPNENYHVKTTKSHLLTLFPLLCDCITLPDVDLRELLRDVFYQASVELHLTSQFKPLLHQTHPIHTTPMVHSTQSDKNSRHSTLTVLNTNHSQGQTLDDSFGGI